MPRGPATRENAPTTESGTDTSIGARASMRRLITIIPSTTLARSAEMTLHSALDVTHIAEENADFRQSRGADPATVAHVEPAEVIGA